MPVDGGQRSAPPEGNGADGRFVLLAGGTFLMGNEDAYAYPGDGEEPVREVRLGPFELATEAVTVADFARFVDATGYVTSAERFGWSFVFAGLLPDDFPATRAVARTPWWRQVYGACWRRPEGPGSTTAGREDHPVVHVSHEDALAYCRWAGARLPTEAEWEYAARGGLVQCRFPWGDELTPGGEHRCNIWQGVFPQHNTAEDGYVGTAPVRTYAPNGFGLYQMVGNVWEWCADYFDPFFHYDGPRVDPTGPPAGERRVIRGGSYLCHASYCHRYRVSARSSSTPTSSTGHMGFRCARDAGRP